MNSATDVFLGISQKFSEQLCQRAVVCCMFMQWVLSKKRMGSQRLNKECFKFSNK